MLEKRWTHVFMYVSKCERKIVWKNQNAPTCYADELGELDIDNII